MSISDMSDPVRIVVVGWGRWGRLCHGLFASQTPGCALHGVVSGDPAKRADVGSKHGCRTYADLDAALADDAGELFVIAVPNDLHAGYAERCLRAGRHVLIDKPMAPTAAECDRMIAAAGEAGRVLSVFHNRRFDGDFLTLRKLVADGRLGDLRWAEMAWQGFGPNGGWRGDAGRGGGRFNDLGSHLIDQLLLLDGGRVTNVYCRLTREFEHKDVESDALLVLTFASGRTGVVDCSSRVALPKPRFYARGTEATFEKHGVDPQEDALPAGLDAVRAAREAATAHGRLRHGAAGKLAGRPDDAERVETLPGAWPEFYERLRSSIRHGTPPPSPASEARRVVQVLEAAHKSGASGEAVGVDI